MKSLFKFLLILAVVVMAGCNKEKPAENSPAPAPVAEPPVLKKDIETLHKAEDLKQSESERISEDKKKIDAVTQ